MSSSRNYRVKEVAALSGVSIRTLHYYDEIGILVPKHRTDAGYRLYDDDDLLRLQQILIGRELGLPLEDIRRSLDDPSFDRRRALLAQKEQLEKQMQNTEAVLASILAALALMDEPAPRHKAKAVDMKDIFQGFDPSTYDAEAKARWGETDLYGEAQRRSTRYAKSDWQTINAEQTAIYRDAADAMKNGDAPESERAREITERHRLLIDRWFYPCSRFRHQGLAGLYEQDERFRESIDAHGAGLTMFLVAAIRANAAGSAS